MWRDREQKGERKIDEIRKKQQTNLLLNDVLRFVVTNQCTIRPSESNLPLSFSVLSRYYTNYL